MRRRALAIGVLVLLALSARALADNDQDQLNRSKAALHGGRYADAKAGFERLAQRGNADAQFYLGRMAAGGMGVPQDTARAVSWYRLAAQQGHTEAQARLGSHYLLGTGIAQSYVEAVRWSRLAAEKGHGGAAYNLAKIYRKGGEGVPADQAEAEKWGKLAMAQGFPDPQGLARRAHAHARSARHLQRGPAVLQGGRHGARGAGLSTLRRHGRCGVSASARLALRHGHGRRAQRRRGGALVSRRRRAGASRRPVQSRQHASARARGAQELPHRRRVVRAIIRSQLRAGPLWPRPDVPVRLRGEGRPGEGARAVPTIGRAR